ncbi:uncharacterized protein [Rhodnius prolixus]|uniref:uncharacterized protein n=1 Tax=Rhodnius prolixus TaxID=13249 RepID=UPI003D189F26
MNSTDLAGTPLQFNSPTPPALAPAPAPAPAMQQTPMFSQPLNFLPHNQRANEPFPNELPSNSPLMCLYPNNQPLYPQPSTSNAFIQQQHAFPNNQPLRQEFNNSNPQSTSNQNAPFSKPIQNQPNEFNQNRNSTDQQQQPCSSNQNAQQQQFKNSNPQSTFNLTAPFSKPFQNQPNEFNQNRNSTDQQQQPCSSNQNAQQEQFKNSNPQSTFNLTAPFSKPFQNQPNEFNQNRNSTDQQQQPCPSNQNAQHRQFKNSNPQSTSNQNAPFSKPFQNQPNEFNQNRNSTDQQQQPCSSNQNAQQQQFKNSNPQSTFNLTAPFSKPFQNQPNEFNQNRNSTDQQQQPCPSNQNAQQQQFKNSNPQSTFNLTAPFSKPFQNQPNEFNQNRDSTDQQQQPCPSNQNAQHRQFKNSNPQSTSNQNAPFSKPFQNQPNEFNQNRNSTDQQQQPCPSNQNAQHRQFKNSNPQSTSNQNAPFSKPFQNQPNEFNQNRNSTDQQQQPCPSNQNAQHRQFKNSNPQSTSNQNAPFNKPFQIQPNEFNQNRNSTDQQQQPCPSNQNAQQQQFKNSNPQSTFNLTAPFSKPFQNQPNEFNQNRDSTDQQQQPCPSNQNAQQQQFKNSNPHSTFNLTALFSKPFQNQPNEFNQNRDSTDQQQQPCPSNQNAQHRQFKNSNPQSTSNQNAPFSKPFQNQLNEFNQNRDSMDQDQQRFTNNQNAQHRQFKNSNPQSTFNLTAPFSKPFQNQPNEFSQNRNSTDQQQQRFTNNQNAQQRQFKNSNPQSTTYDQKERFNKSLQNKPNEFNQNRNSTEFSTNQRRGGHFGGRCGFNRGNGNRGGWKNHNGNNNSKNGNYGNRGRGGFAKRNQNNSEYSLFVGGRSNQTKSNDAETNSSDEKGDFSKTAIVERKEINEERKNRNHQGVIRGGIHKERVIMKGRDPHKVHSPLPKKNDCSSDSDSASTGHETACNIPKQKKKKSRSRTEKKKKEVCPDSTENSEDNKSGGVVQEKEENLPLSKTNLGEGGILMKYIGSTIPNIADAINDNVSLYHKVEGVMMMSDPTSDEPVMERAKNLIHIIEFKLQHPKAKSFFC